MSALDQLRATPNLLTLLRLLTIPFLLIALLEGRFDLAFALFVLAGVTDALDGLAARALGQYTTLGQFLDPIADKLLLSALFLVLTHVGLIPRVVTSLVFGRDIGIISIASLLFFTDAARDFRPTLLGKLNTVVQIAGVTMVLCGRVFAWEAFGSVRDLLMRVIAVLAPLSAAQYGWVVLGRIQEPAAAE